MKNISSIIFFFSIALFMACADKITSTCDEGQGKSDNMPARLSAIQSTVFNPRCVSCHGPIVANADLDLSQGQAYNQLLNKNLVVVNNSAASPLMTRLRSENPNLVMPPEGKLSQVLIDSIAAWIDNGALNN